MVNIKNIYHNGMIIPFADTYYHKGSYAIAAVINLLTWNSMIFKQIKDISYLLMEHNMYYKAKLMRRLNILQQYFEVRHKES